MVGRPAGAVSQRWYVPVVRSWPAVNWLFFVDRLKMYWRPEESYLIWLPVSAALLDTTSFTTSAVVSVRARCTVSTRLGTAAPEQSVTCTFTGIVLPILKLLRVPAKLIG